MSVEKKTKSYHVLLNKRVGSKSGSLEFIGEEPFLIRIEDKPYSVVMRTPGEELFHAAGFCLGEGIVDSTDDFETMTYDKALPQQLAGADREAHGIDGVDFARARPENGLQVPDIKDRTCPIGHSGAPKILFLFSVFSCQPQS